jgi:hypothetical protein
MITFAIILTKQETEICFILLPKMPSIESLCWLYADVCENRVYADTTTRLIYKDCIEKLKKSPKKAEVYQFQKKMDQTPFISLDELSRFENIEYWLREAQVNNYPDLPRQTLWDRVLCWKKMWFN